MSRRILGPVESIVGVLMCGLSVSLQFAIATRLLGREGDPTSLNIGEIMSTTVTSLRPYQPASEHVDGRVWRVVAVVFLGPLMMQLDSTVVNVSLSSISHDLHASIDSAQWIEARQRFAGKWATSLTTRGCLR